MSARAILLTLQGRAMLLAETKELAGPYIAPYISSVKESTAPYVAKLEDLRRSERVEAMVEAFKEAREHPAEKVEELKAKAVDLIKYESLRSYRDHVMSAEFQADTTRLVKDLPVVASAAAQRGAENLKTTATALAAELEAHKVTVKTYVAHGYEVATSVELEAFKLKVAAMTTTLVTQLEAEVKNGVALYKVEGFSLQDFLARLQRVGSTIVVEGKALLATDEPPTEDLPTEPAEAEPADIATLADSPVVPTKEEEPNEEEESYGGGGASSVASEKEFYEDASEESSTAPLPVAY